MPCVQPTLGTLMDYLCFSHDFKGTEFIIWQMKEFGVHESWTQLLRIDYLNLQIHDLSIFSQVGVGRHSKRCTPLFPLYLSKNGDTFIFANGEDDRVIIYHQRDKSVKRIRISKNPFPKKRLSENLCWFSVMVYVESLVSTHWEFATPTSSTCSEYEYDYDYVEDDCEIGYMIGDSNVEKEGPLLSGNEDEDHDGISDRDSGDA